MAASVRQQILHDCRDGICGTLDLDVGQIVLDRRAARSLCDDHGFDRRAKREPVGATVHRAEGMLKSPDLSRQGGLEFELFMGPEKVAIPAQRRRRTVDTGNERPQIVPRLVESSPIRYASSDGVVARRPQFALAPGGMSACPGQRMCRRHEDQTPSPAESQARPQVNANEPNSWFG